MAPPDIAARLTPLTQARRLLRQSYIGALSASGSLKRAKARAAHDGSTLVLTLHRIVPDAELHHCRSPHGMVLTESLFVALIDYLNSATEVIAPRDAGSCFRRSKRPRVMLTFDDGWRDNAEIAVPHLTAAGISACFFVVTAKMGVSQPFWPEKLLSLLRESRCRGSWSEVQLSLQQFCRQAGVKHQPGSMTASDELALNQLKQLPPEAALAWIDEAREKFLPPSSTPAGASIDPMEQLMTWDQARAVASAGQTIGSHTCTHAILPNASPHHLQQELAISRRILQERIPEEHLMPWISYPNGSVSPQIAQQTSNAGYRYGFTNAPGRWSPGTDPFLLPRVNIWNGTLTDTNGIFSSQHLEHALFWKSRHPAPSV